MKNSTWKLPRRTFLKGLGASLALPCLEAMGEEALKEQNNIRRSCHIYFGNGVSLPPESNPIHKDWHWFPHKTGSDYVMTEPLKPLAPYRKKMSIVGGLHHPNAALADIHVCSDIWMTGANLGGSEYKNTISADQVAAAEFRSKTRFPYLNISCDGGVGFKSRIGTIAFDRNGRPITSENDPKRVFERLFKQGTGSIESQRKELDYEAKVVDMVLDNARELNKKLGKNDREKLDQYLTSVSEIEDNVKRSSKWLDTPIKDVDSSHLNLDVDMNIQPDKYFETMFDLISLAFEADLTRTATFMMTREDGMGIADTFPSILFKMGGHHGLSHSGNSEGGYLNWSRYDQFLNSRLAYFMNRLENIQEGNGTALDNTILLYGSGCSSTHNFKNLPLILAGGKNMDLKHGSYINYEDKLPMNNMHYSILKALGIKVDSFGDSNGTLKEIFG